MTFGQLAVGAYFRRGKVTWVKRSTRTAVMCDGPGAGLWFYWGQKETIDDPLSTAR